MIVVWSFIAWAPAHHNDHTEEANVNNETKKKYRANSTGFLKLINGKECGERTIFREYKILAR